MERKTPKAPVAFKDSTKELSLIPGAAGRNPPATGHVQELPQDAFTFNFKAASANMKSMAQDIVLLRKQIQAQDTVWREATGSLRTCVDELRKDHEYIRANLTKTV